MTGRIFSINVSGQKGTPKKMVQAGFLREGYGLEGDAHAGSGNRQVSLLAIEEIEQVESSQLRSDIDDSISLTINPELSRRIDLHPGAFAENITTEGIDLSKVKVGDGFAIGKSVVLRVSQIGKECHTGCAITRQIGRCIMPKQGIFTVVEKGGEVNVRDKITLVRQRSLLFPWLRI